MDASTENVLNISINQFKKSIDDQYNDMFDKLKEHFNKAYMEQQNSDMYDYSGIKKYPIPSLNYFPSNNVYKSRDAYSKFISNMIPNEQIIHIF